MADARNRWDGFTPTGMWPVHCDLVVPGETAPSWNVSLTDAQCDGPVCVHCIPRYVDLMLTHFPASWGGVGGKAVRQAEWKALEAFYKAGKASAKSTTRTDPECARRY